MTTAHCVVRTPVWFALPLCLLLVGGCQKGLEERLADAKLQQEIGSWTESVETLQGILDDQPDHAEANLLLGTAQIRLGQPALAIWPLEVAGRSPEFADHADLALGAAYLRLDQTDAAIAAADRVLARDPSAPMIRAGALRLRASAHMSSRNWDAALEDVDRLLALDKDDIEALALMAQALMGAERIDEAEAVMKRIWDSPTVGETPAAGRAGISLVKLYAYHRQDMDAAERQLEAVLDRFPQDRGVLEFVIDFLERQGRGERAGELLQAALERDPGDLQLRARLADQLSSRGHPDEAEKLLVEATELFDSPQAWITLSDFYRQEQRFDEALAALERTLELLPGTTDLLRFRHAGVLADTGELDRAEAVAKEIEGDAYRNVILGRIAFLRGKPEEALGFFDAGLREWPNNAGARYLAGKAAMASGDLDRGIEELREATRAGLDQTDAPLELALIYLKLGRPASAIATSALLLDKVESRTGPRGVAAAVLLARAQWASGREDAARDTLSQLEQLGGHERLVALERARFVAEKSGPAAAAEELGRASLDLTDPENEPALRLLCDWLVKAGKGTEALSRVDAAVSAHPDVAAFHDIRARVLVNVGRGNEAIATLDRAIELDPDFAPAYEGKGVLLLAAGRADAAREEFDRAAALDPANAAYPYQAAQVELAAGRSEAAEARLRTVLERDPVHAHASNDLAWILAERGESLDTALGLATRASEADPSPAVLDTLGWVQYRRGEHAAAASTFERALALEADSPSIAYRLGLSLLETGDRARAADLFRQALASGSFPEAEAARAQLVQLDAGAS
jgi:tetratricopeptide (TPR) repeat protein